MRSEWRWVAAIAATIACGESTPPVTPIDLAKSDPGAGSGRVRKSPFDCDDAPKSIAAPSSPSAATPSMLPPNGTTFDARASRVATWSGGKTIVRNANDGARVWQGDGIAASFRNDGAQLAAFEDDAIVVRDMPSAAEIMRASRGSGALAAVWSDDGKRLWSVDPSASPGSKVYDLAARTECRSGYPIVPASATSFTVSVDRAHALITWPADSANMASHAAVAVLVQGSPDERVSIAHAPNEDTAFVFSRTGLVVTAVSAGSPIVVWNTRTGSHGDAMVDSSAATAVALSDDGAYIAAIVGARVRVWDARTSKLVRDLAPATGSPLSLAFFPARSRVAIATDGGADLFDAITGAVVWSRSER